MTKLAPQIYEILKSQFQLSSFRKGQAEIITSVINKNDVMAVLPTGGGKSLCYQLPAVLHQKLVIVISPLIALMKDQVSSLKQKGIPSDCFYSGQKDSDKKRIFSELKNAGAYLLYLSPERVQKPGFQAWIKHQNVALFAIDEAHCVSQWGHDFRSEYGQLNILKKLRPDVPMLALTASATPLVLNDIARQLGLQKAQRHIHGFYRPNLYYQVQFCENDDVKLGYLIQAIQQTPEGRILIYCNTRKSTESLCEELKKRNFNAAFYHAGLSNNERTEIQDDFDDGEQRILVATNAFGMGVDHPDVRLVVHVHLPSTIDSLYQEMGRAGRDGKESTCLLLYSKKDKGLQSFFIQQSAAPHEIKSQRWRNLEALVNYAEGSECRHSEILKYYRDSQRITACGHCDSCLTETPRRIARPAAPIRLKKAGRSKVRESVDELNPAEEQKFQKLREWRREKSKELDVAAFVILSDRSLRELSVKNPKSIVELESIYGFGQVKIEKFGQEVLAELLLS